MEERLDKYKEMLRDTSGKALALAPLLAQHLKEPHVAYQLSGEELWEYLRRSWWHTSAALAWKVVSDEDDQMMVKLRSFSDSEEGEDPDKDMIKEKEIDQENLQESENDEV